MRLGQDRNFVDSLCDTTTVLIIYLALKSAILIDFISFCLGFKVMHEHQALISMQFFVVRHAC